MAVSREKAFVPYPGEDKDLPPIRTTKAEIEKRFRTKVNDVKRRTHRLQESPFKKKDKFKLLWEVLYRLDVDGGVVPSMDIEKEPDYLMGVDELRELGQRFLRGYVDMEKGKVKEPDYEQRERERTGPVFKTLTEFKHKDSRSDLVFELEMTFVKATHRPVSEELRVKRVPQYILR